MSVAVLDDNGISILDPVELFRQAVLSGHDFFRDLLDDLGDAVVGQLGADCGFQMVGGIPHDNATSVEGNDHFTQAPGASRVFGYQSWNESLDSVPRDLVVDISGDGGYGFSVGPVAGVGAGRPCQPPLAFLMNLFPEACCRSEAAPYARNSLVQYRWCARLNSLTNRAGDRLGREARPGPSDFDAQHLATVAAGHFIR